METGNEILDEMGREGKVISIDVEITNKDDALKLAATLFNNKSESGVKVHSWGAFSLKAAYENRDAQINAEIARHREKMDFLLDPNNIRSFITDGDM